MTERYALRMTHDDNWSCRRVWATYKKKIAVNAAVFFEKEKKGGVIGRCLHTSLEGCGGES